MLATGGRLAIVTVRVAVSVAMPSDTRRATLNVPAFANVRETEQPGRSNVPSPSRSHAQVSGSPSASVEAELIVTWSPVTGAAGSCAIAATGAAFCTRMFWLAITGFFPVVASPTSTAIVCWPSVANEPVSSGESSNFGAILPSTAHWTWTSPTALLTRIRALTFSSRCAGFGPASSCTVGAAAAAAGNARTARTVTMRARMVTRATFSHPGWRGLGQSLAAR